MRPRVVLITGTSSRQGIGYATARRLAADGHTVYATMRDLATADDLARDVEPGRIEVRTLDLLERSAMGPLLAGIVDAEGHLDAVINNAGYGVIGGVEQVSLELARTSFETNVWGTMALVQETLPIMRRQRHGHLVLVSSCFVAGLPVMGMGYYLAAKAALETLFSSIAVEAAPFGVRVSCFQPGPVATDLERVWGDRIPEGGDPRPSLSEDLYAWVGTSGPAPQAPDEAASALAELVSADSPALAAQSGPASHAYAAAALRDPSRTAEFSELLAAVNASDPD
ncbi:MAG: short-chain dehydrogenase/reductase [Mycobacterium sp.]|nr:short-chain dehydrogenase/reductase [Mycobacterium sp.]